jgi:hypothetical protein
MRAAKAALGAGEMRSRGLGEEIDEYDELLARSAA